MECIGVKLPYKGSACFTATLAMPVGRVEGGVAYADALAACQADILGGADYDKHSRPTHPIWWEHPTATVKLYLPRFEAEYEVPQLKEQLQALGITAPFGPGDLTRAVTDQDASGNLYVSDVLQKVFVKVDEEGTEAAAATRVGISCLCADIPEPPRELEVRFDRPFFFSIVHEPSGLALFAGQVHRPETVGA